MSDPVDRVTTAIFVAIAEKMATDPCCPASEVGRAAIAAIREPTPEMIKAGEMSHGTNGEVINAEEIWRAMIDEALK